MGLRKTLAFERDSLVSATPPLGRHRGWGTGDGGGVAAGYGHCRDFRL